MGTKAAEVRREGAGGGRTARSASPEDAAYLPTDAAPVRGMSGRGLAQRSCVFPTGCILSADGKPGLEEPDTKTVPGRISWETRSGRLPLTLFDP